MIYQDYKIKVQISNFQLISIRLKEFLDKLLLFLFVLSRYQIQNH